MKKGFTLVEMVISVLLVAMAGVLIASFAQALMGSFSKIENTQALLDTTQLVRMTLEKKDQCRLNFAGLAMTFPQAQDTRVTKISGYDTKTKTAASPLVSEGQVMSGAIVQSLNLKPLHRIESGLIVAELRLEFHPQGLRDPADQSQNMIRTIPMVFRIQSGAIIDCWIRNEKASVDVDNICLQLTGGILNSYDKDTGRCKLANGKWFTGSLSSASCPAGAYLPPTATPYGNCFGDASFDDEAAKEPVTMKDGTVIKLARDPVIYGFSGPNTCLCDWAADLSAADLAGAHCMILCVVP
jgi:prepilin-type N-terminal cleavage/methylation domain-containing protein